MGQSGARPRPDYRDEMYGDESGQAPFWVSAEDSAGAERSMVDALQLVHGFVGPFEQDIVIRRVVGGVEWIDVEGWFFRKGGAHGELEFWEVDDA